MSDSRAADDPRRAPLARNADLLPSVDDLDATARVAADPQAPRGTASAFAQKLHSAATREAARDIGRALLDLSRPVIYVVSLLAVLISLAPFTDRSGKAVISTLDVGSRINQIFFPGLLVAMLAVVGGRNLAVTRSFVRWPYIAFVAWLVPAIVFSLDPLLSARRTAFFLIQVAIACLAMLLPRSERQLAIMLAVVSGLALALSYIGVAVAPELSIHQATDAIERELAGDWRGIFRHKNEAGAVMVVLIFVGLYVRRALDRFVGTTLTLAAVVFLVMSHSKSSLILLPFCLAIAYLVEHCRTIWQRAFVLLALLVAFNTATLGSSFPGPVRDTLSRLMPDVTFTGRTDLWRYAIEHVAKRPLVGYGIGAFWRTGATMYKDREEAEPEDTSGWVVELGTDSHNGYLDVAVSIGLPGLAFLLVGIVLYPLRDIDMALREPANRLLTRFYIRCWVFVLYLSSLESLLMPLNPIWYIMLQSVFGLALLARFRVSGAATAAGPPMSAPPATGMVDLAPTTAARGWPRRPRAPRPVRR